MQEMSVEEVRKRAKSGPMMLLTRRGFSALIGLLSTIILARILAPRDFGLATMATVIIAFSYSLRDFGLTNAIMRKGTATEEEVNFLFWFNTAMTFGLAGILALIAPFAARFFGEPIVTDLILVALIGFIIGGVSLQHSAIMKRDLRFGAVAFGETASVLAGFVVTLVIALIRKDYWAIIIGTIAQSATRSLFNITMTRWCPGKPAIIPGAGELLRFGANSTLYSLVNYGSRYSTTFVIGYFFSPAALGFFNRAHALYSLPLNNLLSPIAQATMPVMARLRPHPEHYRSTYLGLVEMLSALLVPASIGLCFAGVPLTVTLLGAKWETAGMVLAALAPGLAAYGAIYPISDLLVTQNRAGELRAIGFYDLFLRFGGTLIGAQFGFLEATIGFTSATLIMLPLRLYIAGRSGPISAGDQWRALLPAVPLGIGTGIGAAAGTYAGFAASLSPLLTLIAIAISGIVGFLLSIAMFKRSRQVFKNLIASVTGRYTVAAPQQT